MKLNKKGFSLVEILVAILILGILSGLAVVSVSSMLQTAKEDYYDTIEKTIILAAQNYYGDHRGSLPRDVGQKRRVTIETLIEYNYLKRGDVVDYGKTECNVTDSYVSVIKYSQDDYLYTLYLECPATTIDHEKSAENSLDVKVKLNWESKNVSAATADIDITVDSSISRISSYQYTIFKSNQVVYTSDSIAVGADKVDESIKLKQYVPGLIRVVVTAYDIYGNVKTESATDSIYNNEYPECGKISPLYDLDDDSDWTNDSNASRKITVRCSDGSSTCLRRNFSKTFTTDMAEGIITVSSTTGKERDCAVPVMIDKTKPNCGDTDDSTVWTSGGREVSVECNDATSGCTKNKFTTTFKESNKEVKTSTITIKDVAGNSRQCDVDVYVDNKAPTCDYSVGYSSTTWTSSNRTVSVGCKDSGSGCKKTTFSKTVSSTAKTTTITIEDNVGNKTNCTVNAYVDKTPPTTPTSGAIGAVSGSSTTGTIKTAAGGSTDAHSGFSHYLYKVTNTNSAPSKTDSGFTTSRNFTRACGRSYYAWVVAVDKVGNRSNVKSLGNTKDGANKYSNWGTCSKKCGGGTQTRTNTCALITSGKTKTCNTMSCCSKTTTSWSGVWGSCSRSCGGGTRKMSGTKKSNYDGSYCGTVSKSEPCNTHSCCTIEWYGGRYCYNYFGAHCYGNGCPNTWVCRGYNTGCVAATNYACGLMGGTYFYFKRC